jgi:cell division protease FtsH
VTPIEPPTKKRFPYWVLLVPAGALLLFFGLFLAIWQFLTPADRVVPVAYSDFIVDVHAGKVEEILIRNREIRYRLHTTNGQRPTPRETVGPIPDQALVDSLRPDDPNAPRPKIIFEK